MGARLESPIPEGHLYNPLRALGDDNVYTVDKHLLRSPMASIRLVS
jgi:hypothetical protein